MCTFLWENIKKSLQSFCLCDILTTVVTLIALKREVAVRIWQVFRGASQVIKLATSHCTEV